MGFACLPRRCSQFLCGVVVANLCVVEAVPCREATFGPCFRPCGRPVRLPLLTSLTSRREVREVQEVRPRVHSSPVALAKAVEGDRRTI